jgi:hypothetical protein
MSSYEQTQFTRISRLRSFCHSVLMPAFDHTLPALGFGRDMVGERLGRGGDRRGTEFLELLHRLRPPLNLATACPGHER